MADVSQLKINGVSYNLKDTEARSAIEGLPSPMVFKGTLGTGGTITELPEASTITIGHTYKVVTAGTYNSFSAKVGDMLICSDTPEWTLVPSGDEPSGTVTNIETGTGLVGGPITATGTIGLDNSGVTAGTYQGITVDQYGRVTKAEDKGYTTNVGTITGIKMNGASKGTSGIVDLGTIITDISGKQDNLIAGTGIKLEGSTIYVNPSDVVKGKAFTITGDGTTTYWDCAHNLGTKDVIVQVYNTSDGAQIAADIARTSEANVRITFNTAPENNEEYRVLVSKVVY